MKGGEVCIWMDRLGAKGVCEREKRRRYYHCVTARMVVGRFCSRGANGDCGASLYPMKCDGIACRGVATASNTMHVSN